MAAGNKKSITTFDLQENTFAIEEIIKDQYDAYRSQKFIEPLRHSYFNFFLMKTGFLKHSIDFKIYTCKSHDVFFLMPWQVYLFKNAKDISGISVSFSQEMLTEAESALPVITNAAINNKLSLSADEYEHADYLLSKMMIDYRKPGRFSPALLRNYVTSLLLHLSKIYEQQNQPNKKDLPLNPLVEKFKQLLTTNWNKQWTVSGYADKLYITAGHLNQMIKKQTGKNASEWIREKKLLEIKRQLIHTELSIKEIAYETGFTDPAYFNRFFKISTGKTPVAFREEILKKYNSNH